MSSQHKIRQNMSLFKSLSDHGVLSIFLLISTALKGHEIKSTSHYLSFTKCGYMFYFMNKPQKFMSNLNLELSNKIMAYRFLWLPLNFPDLPNSWWHKSNSNTSHCTQIGLTSNYSWAIEVLFCYFLRPPSVEHSSKLTTVYYYGVSNV